MTESQGRVEKATRAQLRELGISVQSNGLAASAVVLSRLLDEGPTPRDAAAVAGQLRGTMAELVKLAAANPKPTASPLDELLAKRKARGA